MAKILTRHPWIDLRLSKIDWDKSKPEEGIYRFLEKKYVNYKRRQTRPMHWIEWIRYWPGDNYSDYLYYKAIGYRDVYWKDKLYWPENLAPTDGKYIIGDLIIMQYSLLEWAKEKAEEEQIAMVGGQSAINKVEAEIESQGGKIVHPEEITEKNLNKYVEKYL